MDTPFTSSGLISPNEIIIENFVHRLQIGYSRSYGNLHCEYKEIIAWAANTLLEIISSSDACYHNVEHTCYVTLVGMEILRGKHIKDGHVSPEDWLHYIISLLCHDVGYVKGVCKNDRPEESIFATGKNEEMVQLQDGATDAALTPFHVDRGQLFVTERFGGHRIISTEIISRNIQHTRFPVPKDSDAQKTDNYPGLVRAADLIGQLSDPRYLQKISALFYEFEETGTNAKLGYKTPGDLKRGYHKFYWSQVYPYVKDSLKYLSVTNEGKHILARLYSNVFQVEHTNHQRICKKISDNNCKETEQSTSSEPMKRE